jgi:hypothetical protein
MHSYERNEQHRYYIVLEHKRRFEEDHSPLSSLALYPLRRLLHCYYTRIWSVFIFDWLVILHNQWRDWKRQQQLELPERSMHLDRRMSIFFCVCGPVSQSVRQAAGSWRESNYARIFPPFFFSPFFFFFFFLFLILLIEWTVDMRTYCDSLSRAFTTFHWNPLFSVTKSNSCACSFLTFSFILFKIYIFYFWINTNKLNYLEIKQQVMSVGRRRLIQTDRSQ